MDKSIQEALKWIYASLGGDISDLAAVDDITAILNAIAKLDTVQKIKSATELPVVTGDDDGDVLTVVEGAWAKAAPSSGGSDAPDMTMLCTDYSGMWQEATYTLLSGTYAGLKAKLMAHAPVRCMVFLGITETEEFPGMWGQFVFEESMLWTFGQGETEFIQLACDAGDETITVYVLPDGTVTTQSPWD